MSNRFLREELLTSQRWNDCSDAAQVLFVRLLLVVDDFGCFDGRPTVIRGRCYAGNHFDVDAPLTELQAAGMIVRYSNADKPYLALMRWKNEIRGKRKFPAPPVNVDVSDVKVKGQFKRDIGWENPSGCDEVSLLLDAQMRPCAVQPPEWRMVDKDYGPNGMVTRAYQQVLATIGAQALDTTRPAVTTHQPDIVTDATVRKPYKQDVDVDTDIERVKSSSQTQIPPTPPGNGAQGLQPPPTTTANGEGIQWQNGEWRGLTAAQRLKWQEMFVDLSIPDQIDRACAWLTAVEPKQREASLAGGAETFLIRWLLREAKPRGGTGTITTRHDA